MYNIVVLNGDSMNSDLAMSRYYQTEEIYRSFLTLGHNATFVDFSSSFGIKDLNEALKKPIDFVWTMAEMSPASLTFPDGEGVTNKLKIPTISYLMEEPCYRSYVFEKPLYHHIIVGDNKKYYAIYPYMPVLSRSKPKMISYLPRGGATLGQPLTEEQFDKKNKRILFLGSHIVAPKEKMWAKRPKFIRDFTEDVYCQYSYSSSISEAFAEVIKHRDVIIDDELSQNILSIAGRDLVIYIVGHLRSKYLKFLIENGYELDIYGIYWPDEYNEYKNVTLTHGVVQYGEALELFRKYKLTICPYSNSSDRLLNALANGCQVLAHSMVFIDEELSDFKGIYQIKNEETFCEKAAEGIRTALEDTSFSDIKRTYDHVVENHMWINRAQSFIDIFEASKTKFDILEYAGEKRDAIYGLNGKSL